MSDDKHTPLAYGAALTAAVLNAPLGELDAAIVAVEDALAQTVLPITTTDAVANSGQAVVPVASTDGFVVGQPVWIGDVNGTHEVGTILSIQAGVSLTLTANLANTYAAGKVVSGSPAELVAARGTFATLALRLAAAIDQGTAFPGSPVTNQLFRRTDRGGAVYQWTGAAWVQISVPNVTAFWSSPSTNDRAFRTDLRREYVYTGGAWVVPYPLGQLGYTDFDVDSVAITSETTLLSQLVTVDANRQIRIKSRVRFDIDNNDTVPRFKIKEGATILRDWTRPSTTAVRITYEDECILTPSAGAHTYSVTLDRVLGTGSITAKAADPGSAAYLLIEDIGPA